MIHANVRSRLQAHDLEVALAALAGASAARRRELEARLAQEGPDGLLDDPDLAERLLAMHTILAPSELLFVYVVVRRYLCQGGVDDADLSDYLAAVVVDFGERDRARRITPHEDTTHDYLVDLLAELERTEGSRRLQLLVHLGNYALWLAGIFPDRIASRQQLRGGPDVQYFDALGRRGYALASAHALAAGSGLESIWATAAERFPVLRGTLNHLSDRVFFPGVFTADRVLRELGRARAA